MEEYSDLLFIIESILSLQEQQQAEILNLKNRIELLSNKLNVLNTHHADNRDDQNNNMQTTPGFPQVVNIVPMLPHEEDSKKKVRRTEKKPVDIDSILKNINS